MLHSADWVFIIIFIIIPVILSLGLAIPGYIGSYLVYSFFIFFIVVVGKINNPNHTFGDMMYTTFAWPSIVYTTLRDNGTQ